MGLLQDKRALLGGLENRFSEILANDGFGRNESQQAKQDFKKIKASLRNEANVLKIKYHKFLIRSQIILDLKFHRLALEVL